MIDDKIKSLGKYFGGFDVIHDRDEKGKETTFKLLKIWMPTDWDVFPKEGVNYSITPHINQENGQCGLYGVGEIEFSGICDFAHEIIKHNLDKKAKFDLFQKFRVELENVFNSNTLEDLQTLVFSFNNIKEKTIIDDINKSKKQTKTKQENRGLLVENEELTNSKINL